MTKTILIRADMGLTIRPLGAARSVRLSAAEGAGVLAPVRIPQAALTEKSATAEAALVGDRLGFHARLITRSLLHPDPTYARCSVKKPDTPGLRCFAVKAEKGNVLSLMESKRSVAQQH